MSLHRLSHDILSVLCVTWYKFVTLLFLPMTGPCGVMLIYTFHYNTANRLFSDLSRIFSEPPRCDSQFFLQNFMRFVN